MSDLAWCPRCGGLWEEEPGLPHDMCWDRYADDELISALLECARGGSNSGLRLLAEVGDPRAADALRLAMSDTNQRVQRAAVSALGWSGTTEDVPAVASLLPDPYLHDAAVATIAELGGPAAADSLAAVLAAEPDLSQMPLLEALAWLGDQRALNPLRQLVRQSLERGSSSQVRGIGWAMSRLGDDTDCQRILQVVEEFARQSDANDAADKQRYWNAYRRVYYAWSEFLVAGQAWPAAVEAGHERMDLWFEAKKREHPSGPGGVPARLRVPRTVPRRHMTRIEEDVPDDGEWPRAKFGGQPDWRADPTWPVDSGGHQLVFYGQLPLAGDEPRTAYIFMVDGGDTWELLGPGNALVVQPGAPPHLPTVASAEGPRLFEWVMEEPPRFRRRSRMASRVRYVDFEDGADPINWDWEDTGPAWLLIDGLDWNKVGGTPLFLQGEETPDGDGWSFAFQFTADRTGHELADGAECYGWVNDDGRGAFGWQCH